MLDKIGKQIELQRQSSDQVLEQKSIQLDALQSRVADVIAEELQQQELTQKQLMKVINEKAEAIKKEIGIEQAESSEMIGSMQQYLEEDVPNLYDRLKESIKDREQTEEIILKQIQDEFVTVQNKLAEEKRMREEGEEILLNRIKDIRARVQD